jgi:hypothetical protein
VISQLIPNYWATNGFYQLTQTGVFPGTHAAILLVMFVVLFGAGVTLFNRRLDV